MHQEHRPEEQPPGKSWQSRQRSVSALGPCSLLQLVVTAVFLVLAIGGAFAVADESEEAAGAGTSLPGIQAGPVTTEPSVAVELPHTDLGRDEILALVGGVFEDTLEGVAGPFDDLVVDEFLSSNAAVIQDTDRPEPAGLLFGEPSPDSTRALLFESSIPLRREGEVLDLGLERVDGAVEPTNPLVNVEIPQELKEGIELPGVGVQLTLPGAADGRTPSILQESTALYPNVFPNTDFIVAPIPTGIETFTVLRDPAAPRVQEIKIDLPPGGGIAEDPDGSISLHAEGEVLGRVSPPSAIDAAGQAVAASMKAEGESIYLSVDPNDETNWPVLVDPIFETYQWEGTSLTACSDFNRVGVDPNSQFWWYCGTFVNGGSYILRGLAAKAYQGTFANGSYIKLTHEVPRLKQEELKNKRPTSYFAGMSLSTVRLQTSGGSASPYPMAGIWDDHANYWAGKDPYYAVWGYPGNASGITNGSITFTAGGDEEAKVAVPVALNVNESSAATTGERRFSVGAMSFELGDDGAPKVVSPSYSPWVNASAKVPLTAEVSDTGLGVKRATFQIPGQGTVEVGNACAGTVADPCPAEWTATLAKSQYNPSLMPQGEDFVPIVGKDVVGNSSPPSNAEVFVDHTAPALSLSGNLTEQATAGSNLREYVLNYAAKDGDDATAAALIPAGSAGKSEGQLERPMGVAMAADGSTYAVDRLNNRVVKYDKEGKFALQFGTTGSGDGQFNDPRGIDIAPDGTIWVADMGNDRIQAFSPTGTFLRKAKFSDSASEPYSIACGPGGVLWVTDIGLHRVVKLSENPISTLLITTGKEPGGGGKGTAVITPTGVATDKSGNVWIADGGLGKILELDSAGKPLFSFGTGGSGDGQIDGIVGIDISPAGNIAITERNNGRVQIFKPDGSYLRKFGSAGSGNNQFFEAGGLSFGPDNMLAVADAGNKRVARWSHADQDPQSGAAKVVVKVDGTAAHAKEPGCTTKNCQISGSWTLDADDYTAGAHKVEVIATDAVGIAQTKTIDIETHGDHTDPAIALSGTMTQQASIGTTRPSYKLKAVATDTGPTGELKSGVASTTIKVDGAVVDSANPGCPAGGCSMTREWTLNSASYEVGTHTVEVKATDAAGRVGTKSLTISIARDTTAPEVQYLGNFYSAPSGWLEQKIVSYEAYVQDPGYGVTSVELKIDGVAVGSETRSCPAGGCESFFGLSKTVDMAAFSGGSHPTEFIARDGAGNAVKRTWMINVTPDGVITVGEATDTLEAMESTVSAEGQFMPVASTGEFQEPDSIVPGNSPHLSEDAGQVVSSGVSVETIIAPASDSMTIEGTEGQIEVSPALPTQDAVVVNGAAAVLPSSQAAIDTVVRPQYNGAQMFTNIRDAAAPEKFEWHLKLNPGQYMVQASSGQIEIKSGSGQTAWLLSAEAAHDATGKAVPTTLSILNATDIALNVPHRGKGFVYPIAAGSSYETGYALVTTVFEYENEAGEQAEVEIDDDELGPEPDGFEPPPPGHEWTANELAYLVRGSHFAHPTTVPAPRPLDDRTIFYRLYRSQCGPSCSKWNAKVYNTTYFIRRPIDYDKEPLFLTWWEGGSEVHATVDQKAVWTLTHNSTVWNCGALGAKKVAWGSHEHLTAYGHFTVESLISKNGFRPETNFTLFAWVYPNGFQQKHVNWDWHGQPVDHTCPRVAVNW